MMVIMELAGMVEELKKRLLNVTTLLLVVWLIYQSSIYIYNLFLHPLRSFPGPRSCAASYIPYIRATFGGFQQWWLLDLHKQYGPVVRIGPFELSYSSSQAWRDIYGHRRSGQSTFLKNDRFYLAPGNPERTIVNSLPVEHARIRRIFSHAFSDRALKLQEPLFLKYSDKLIQAMRDKLATDERHKFDMVNMYNFTTFDVMGDLTFGESLGMLENSEYHPWVSNLFASFHFGIWLFCIRCYPLLERLLLGMIPQSILERQKVHQRFSIDRVDRRLAKKDARPDIWGLVLAQDEESGLTLRQMYANSEFFMLAGTETTASLLSGLTYHLLKNPDKLARLTAEIRGAFAAPADINIERVQSLRYLQACVDEALRMYPPASSPLPRIVPPEGAVVDGKFVPGGMTVWIAPLVVFRDPRNFKDPDVFVPERAFETEYADDDKAALQPFSLGPANCIGKNMAYHEIRLIVTKVLYNFDLKLCSESENWVDQKLYIMWEKPPLMCTATPVAR